MASATSALPSEEQGESLVSAIMDPWGHPLRWACPFGGTLGSDASKHDWGHHVEIPQIELSFSIEGVSRMIPFGGQERQRCTGSSSARINATTKRVKDAQGRAVRG